MNNPDCDGQFWMVDGPFVVTQPAGTPLSSPNALANRLARNSSHALGTVIWPKNLAAAKPLSELYVGFWWKMNADFQGYSSNGNKLFFICATNYPLGSQGEVGVFALQGQPDNFPWTLVFSPNSSTLNNSHACGGDAIGNTCFPNVGSVPIYRDTWYRVEAYVKSSTCRTCQDATVRWWVNNTLIGNYENLNYGSGIMNEFQINQTWDGQAAAQCYDAGTNPKGRDCSREWIHYFDHLHISNPNCPAGGCPAPAYLVITSSLLSARTGTPYSSTLAAAGGARPYTWFLQSGNLPAGLSLNQNTGVISGTPTCVGRSDFTIRVADASQPALTATKSYSIIASGTGAPCSAPITTGPGTRAEGAQFSARAVAGKMIFNLPVTGSAQYRLSLYDISGKQVYTHQSMGEKEIRIRMPLKNGVYLARFMQGANAGTLRFNVLN